MTAGIERLSTGLVDRYVIEREVGQGGMATVYVARDVKHDRPVALKVLRPELAAVIGAERFLAEIKTTANLQHPHILPLHDSGEVDGMVFYVMPLVEGESLRERLSRERQLPVTEAVRIATEVAGALDYAHRKGIIHRDIKPENILLHDGQALVADFGIALAAANTGGGRMTETGLSLGTPHYMSPEQAMGERDLDGRTDVYALGCVLYEMLSGEPPFTGPTAQAIVARVMTDEPRSLTAQRRTVPPHVDAAIQTALAKLPADRFAGAADFQAALQSPAFVSPTAVAAPGARPGRGSRLPATQLLALGAAVATALAAWGWIRAWRTPSVPTTWQRIMLGDSLRLVTEELAMALAPDGSQLVFKDNHQNGLLWIKRRGQLEATPLASTERAHNPVFSPDGEWIAFVADGHLKKVRALGGPSVTLADSASGGFGGAAWLDDGTIVFGDASTLEFRRVNASGGRSTTVLRDTTLGGGVGYPVGLPGARGVLFQKCSSGCVTMSIYALDLRTGVKHQLLDGVVGAWYLPIGQLLYVRRDGVALAAPFDLENLEITGEGVPVLEDVAVRPSNGFAPLAWSASETLVYIGGTVASTEDMFVRVDRAGTTSPIDTAWYGEFNSLDKAPDGGRLAVGAGGDRGLNIWIKQLSRGPFTRLTFGNNDRRPAWSPDGRLVAFIRDTGVTSVVYGRSPDGSGPDRLLARIDRLVQEVAWSPDGRWLVLRTDNGTTGAGDLVGVRLQGDTAAVPLVTSRFTELHPTVSPDGRWLAFTSNESGRNEVYVRPFPNTAAARWQVSRRGGSGPVWSGSGRELFYLGAEGMLMAAAVQSGATLAVGQSTPLFAVSGFVLDDWHQSFIAMPDGRAFVFQRPRHMTEANRAPLIVWVDGWFRELERRLER